MDKDRSPRLSYDEVEEMYEKLKANVSERTRKLLEGDVTAELPPEPLPKSRIEVAPIQKPIPVLPVEVVPSQKPMPEKPVEVAPSQDLSDKQVLKALAAASARYSQERIETAPSQARQFPVFEGGRLCDVCSQSLENVTAYTVPTDVFYASETYKAWCIKERLKRLEMMGVPCTPEMGEDLFYAQKAQDNTDVSAVCENCLHMFQ